MFETRVQKRAHNAVYKALRSGILQRPYTCEGCSQLPNKYKVLQAHHEDYDKPLEVTWLCASCHNKKRNVRAPKGEEHYNSKLTEEDVIRIRKRYEEEDISQAQLAREFNIVQSMISRIVRYRIWTHV